MIQKQITFQNVYIENGKIFIKDFICDDKGQFKCVIKQIDFVEPKSLKNFSLFNDLPKTLKFELKSFYKSKEFTFFIMNDYAVYVLGKGPRGKLGLSVISKAHELTEISYLSDKRIEEFYKGDYCMYARSIKNEIFSTGYNAYGRPRGDVSMHDKIRPDIVVFFTWKNIIKIVCGILHCLALSSNGIIYGWCHEKGYQIACALESENYPTPICIDSKYGISVPIKWIDCNHFISLAVDINGSAYYWGKIYDDKTIDISPYQISYIAEKPLKMIIEKVEKLYKIYRKNECIVLKRKRKCFYL